jgi:predicted ester cyclase
MRTGKFFCLMAVFCGVLALAMAYSQSKTGTPNPKVQVSPGIQNNPLAPTPQTKSGPTTQGSTQNQPALADKSHQVNSPEHHKVVVNHVFQELFSQGRCEFISQVYAPNCIVHEGNKTRTIDEAVAEGKGFRESAPDLHMNADRMVVNGDIVTVDWTSQGTHTGHSRGVRPTGNHIVMHGTSRFRMVNGKIAEVWNNYDRDGLFRQMGVNPKLGRLYDMTQDFIAAVHRFFVNDNG